MRLVVGIGVVDFDRALADRAGAAVDPRPRAVRADLAAHRERVADVVRAEGAADVAAQCRGEAAGRQAADVLAGGEGPDIVGALLRACEQRRARDVRRA
jgi:hypothetical protein